MALSAADGSVLWSTTVGTPVPSGNLPCGDISPTVGITSTPVVDSSRNEIFVVADELVGIAIEHRLVGLDATTGAVRLDQVVDPPGSDPKAQLQRVALTLDAGQVIVGYGGNSGDCSDYHGWLVAAPETGGALKTFEVDAAPGERQGAIWMGGAAPIVDGNGNVWVAAGNGSSTAAGDPYDYSDSVLELSSSLTLLQYFSPSTWRQDNLTDADLGSSSPALVDGLVFQAGKSGTGYLLDSSALGGIGGQKAQLAGLCGGVVDGGDAFANSVVYAPCSGGVVAVRVGTSPPSLTRLWQTATKSKGPPIVAGGLVWTITGTTLYGLDPATGAASVQFTLSGEANHFPTPSVGDGLPPGPGHRPGLRLHPAAGDQGGGTGHRRVGDRHPGTRRHRHLDRGGGQGGVPTDRGIARPTPSSAPPSRRSTVGCTHGTRPRWPTVPTPCRVWPTTAAGPAARVAGIAVTVAN